MFDKGNFFCKIFVFLISRKIIIFSQNRLKQNLAKTCIFPERNLTPEKVHSCPIVGKCCSPKMSKFNFFKTNMYINLIWKSFRMIKMFRAKIANGISWYLKNYWRKSLLIRKYDCTPHEPQPGQVGTHDKISNCSISETRRHYNHMENCYFQENI